MFQDWRYVFIGLLKNRGDRGSAPYGESLRSATLGTLIPAVVASDSFDFSISDACICSYFDKSHDIHSNGGKYKCAISSFKHRIVINEVKELLASCDSTSPRLGLVKRKQVSVLGLDTCCSVSSSEHYSVAKVDKKIVKTMVA